MRATVGSAVSWLLRLVLLAVVFGLINAVLYGAQELWHYGDKRAFRSLEAQMNRRLTAIRGLEAKLTDIEARLDQLTAQMEPLRGEKQAIERRYAKSGAPPRVYSHYLSVIRQANDFAQEGRTLLADHRALLQEYSSLIDQYNEDVPRINDLADKAFSRWYIIPIPVPGARSRSRAELHAPSRVPRAVEAW